jgi:hypothetical protein
MPQMLNPVNYAATNKYGAGPTQQQSQQSGGQNDDFLKQLLQMLLGGKAGGMNVGAPNDASLGIGQGPIYG